MKTETFCVLTKDGEIVTIDRFGPSPVVAEYPAALAWWRADDTQTVWQAINATLGDFW